MTNPTRERSNRLRAEWTGSFYGEDLARIHHEGFTRFVRAAAPEILRLLDRAGVRSGAVVDLGCGSGVWLDFLVRAGFDAHGVDISAALLKIAKTVSPGATLHLSSVYDYRFPPCVAVTAIGEVLNYLPPGGEPPSLARLFKRVNRALYPGGLFLFDMLVSTRGRPLRYRGWTSGRTWTVLTDVREDPDRARLTREITSFRLQGTRYRRCQERHRLIVHRRDDIERWLREAGFTVRVRRSYGKLRLSGRHLSFEARRPKRHRSGGKEPKDA